jgi:glycosyltransferase involved in cell wall biosynthesis
MEKDTTRILFAIDGAEFGGGERVFAQLMNRLPVDECEIFLISQENADFYTSISNPRVHVIPVDFSSRIDPSLFFKIASIIRRNVIQIVNGQGGRAEFYTRIASRLAGSVRYVSTIAMPVEGYNVSPPIRKIYSFFDRLSERYVDRFIVVSEALKEAIVRRHGIVAERVVRIYNGIEIEYFDPGEMTEVRRKIREEFGVEEDRPLIAGIGRMVWQKGFDCMIHAMPDVLRAHPRAILLMIGDGPLRSSLEAQTREMHLTDKVVFTGFRSDVREILAGIDVLAVPSLLEGFPMVTLEAMAMEKPIVATDIDGMREQFIDEVSGLLVPPGDPKPLALTINRLLNDKLFAAKIGSNARERTMSEFPIEKTVSKTLEVYRSLLPTELKVRT